MAHIKSYASDNYAPVHPAVMDALVKANIGHVPSYGADMYTEAAIEQFKEIFGADIEVFFVYNGTGANTIGLTTVTRPYNAIFVASTGHINADECGAPEKSTGCKLIDLPSLDGKIDVNLMPAYLHRLEDQHQVQPNVISITQATEYGTVYSAEELKTITEFAKKRNFITHMDGARIANAIASLVSGNQDKSLATKQPRDILRQTTKDVGVDMLSFGATKNGMMFGEAVVFFNKDLAKDFKYFRKQGMQLHSKMRYIGAQFSALLSDDLWYRNALHANNMAKLLADKLQAIPQIKITQKVDANTIFAVVPKEIISELQQKFAFYTWDYDKSEVRWMTSFDTAEADIKEFANEIQLVVAKENE